MEMHPVGAELFHIVTVFLKALSYEARKPPLLGKHVQTNMQPTIQERCFLCSLRRDRCWQQPARQWTVLVAITWEPQHTHATIEELCFLYVVRAGRIQGSA
jgi:hypothetical protein